MLKKEQLILEIIEKIYGYNYEYIELNILKGLCITRNKYK